MNKIIIATYDEFNNVTAANMAAYILKRRNIENHCVVNTVSKYAPIYSYADEIHARKEINKINNSIYKDDACIVDWIKTLESEVDGVGDHIYKLIFSNISKAIQQEKEQYLYNVPSSDAYSFYKNKRPYVVVHGRNKDVDITRYQNRLFGYLIDHLLNNGINVINTTMSSPGFVAKNYYEDDCIDSYEKNLAIFCNANMVFLHGHAAGVTQHILSYANVCLLITEGYDTWVTNPKFGYNGSSIYESRINTNRSLVTEYLLTNKFNGDKVLALANAHPPELKYFFNNDIIKRVEI